MNINTCPGPAMQDGKLLDKVVRHQDMDTYQSKYRFLINLVLVSFVVEFLELKPIN